MTHASLSDPVFAPVRNAFRVIAATIVPQARLLGDAEWRAVEGLIEGALAARPATIRRQLRLFVRVIWWLPLVTRGRPFGALSDAARADVLHAIERSPIAILRRGLWGLRTVVFLGYYARADAAAEVGWRADPRGWAARGPDARHSGAVRASDIPVGDLNGPGGA